MAQKRMFDISVVDNDKFVDMPVSSRLLYYELGMRADDEGFITPKRVIRMLGLSEDDLKVLITKGFVIFFESGVVVITDWKQNNYLDKNRIKPTQFVQEKSTLGTDSLDRYVLNNGSTDVKRVFNQYRVEEKSIEENKVTNVTSKKKSTYGNKVLNKFIDAVKNVNGGSLPVGSSQAKDRNMYTTMFKSLTGYKKLPSELKEEDRKALNEFFGWLYTHRTDKDIHYQNIFTFNQKVRYYKTNILNAENV